jgi:hypothetical protein
VGAAAAGVVRVSSEVRVPSPDGGPPGPAATDATAPTPSPLLAPSVAAVRRHRRGDQGWTRSWSPPDDAQRPAPPPPPKRRQRRGGGQGSRQEEQQRSRPAAPTAAGAASRPRRPGLRLGRRLGRRAARRRARPERRRRRRRTVCLRGMLLPEDRTRCALPVRRAAPAHLEGAASRSTQRRSGLRRCLGRRGGRAAPPASRRTRPARQRRGMMAR